MRDNHKLMNILVFIISVLVNITLLLTILVEMSLLGQVLILIIVDFAIQYLAYRLKIL